ncbi:MAG: aspartate--ammonia ligase, partial [Oscillospiraceae bacterium]|nr:aspartate--ammonia ligase [Oscillospiraceae bacterium]
EDLDTLHSAYVDQWDWEKVITEEERNIDFLKQTVQKIVDALSETQRFLHSVFPQLSILPKLGNQVTFISSQELENLYPNLTSKEREHRFVKDHPVTFLIGIGGQLASGKPHDGRAPDYDDWNLNGDLLVWDSVGQCAMELSSMGIRVNPETLDRQLTTAGCDNRRQLPFHKMLLNNELPLTIGGGIGQSRVSMLLLGKAHIGEVQSSLWSDDIISLCEENGVVLL